MPGGSISLHSNSMFWRSRARIVVKFSAVTLSTVTLYKSVDWSEEGGSRPVTDHVLQHYMPDNDSSMVRPDKVDDIQ